MRGTIRLHRLVGLAAALLLVLAVGASAASAEVLKNKQTGETITGTVTDQKINGKNVFMLISGQTIFLDLSEWERVDADGTATDAASPAAASPAAASAPGEYARKAYVFPLRGVIEDHAMVEALERGLGEAKRQNVAVVILRMDTPGGRVDLTEKIIQTLEKVDWAPVVALVEGGDKRALSAGTYICLATRKIYMAPGTTIGAATPYSKNVKTGAAQVDAKLTSAFRARFRSLAETHGYPPALVDAMVDSKVSIVQVFVSGKQMIVTEEEAKNLEDAHRSDGLFKRGKVISRAGEPITLTSNEAAEFGICAAVVSGPQDVLRRMGLGDSEIIEAAWVPSWIEQLNKDRKARIEAYANAFKAEMTKAKAFYDLAVASGTKPDVRNNINQCMTHIKESRRILSVLEKMAVDEKYDMTSVKDLIADRKRDLDALLTRLDVLRKNL